MGSGNGVTNARGVSELVWSLGGRRPHSIGGIASATAAKNALIVELLVFAHKRSKFRRTVQSCSMWINRLVPVFYTSQANVPIAIHVSTLHVRVPTEFSGVVFRVVWEITANNETPVPNKSFQLVPKLCRWAFLFCVRRLVAVRDYNGGFNAICVGSHSVKGHDNGSRPHIGHRDVS